MKLAFCLFNYFPYGGMQRTFFRVIDRCHNLGHEVHVFTMSWEGDLPDWVELHMVNKKGLSNHARAKYFSDFILSRVRKPEFDCVVGFNKMAGLDWYYGGDGCFVSRKYSWFSRLLPRYQAYAELEKAVFHSHSQANIWLISSREKERYQEVYQTPESRLYLLPPGIHPDRCRPDNALVIRSAYREKMGLQETDFALLIIASKFKTKGLDRAIEALNSLPFNLKAKTSLFVVGSDKVKYYKKLSRDSQVVFLGSRDDVSSLLLMADLLIHPARLENTGSTLLEAILAGTPILTSGACGYAHYVLEAKAGEVTEEPFSQNGLNHHLLLMLNKERLNQYQKNALQYEGKSHFFGLIDQMVELLERPRRE